jgi:hypothetical protein
MFIRNVGVTDKITIRPEFRRQQYETSPPRTIQVACIGTPNRKMSLYFHIYRATSYVKMRMHVWDLFPF